MKTCFLFLFMSMVTWKVSQAASILIPMDNTQSNHLKAYGITFWVISGGNTASWLLNYRGGSFLFPYSSILESECRIRGVSVEIVPDAQVAKMIQEISSTENNMDLMKLETAPKIAVYSPKSKLPWDDAVTLVLKYAEIPYEVIYDEEVIQNKLPIYDWLHLHHEDFTGQYGRFWAAYRNAPWYVNDQANQEAMAARLGFSKVSQMKLEVAKKIKEFTVGGGFLFAMCSATDSYDIALSAEGIDICDVVFDGDPMDREAQRKLDFSKCIAFQNFKLDMNVYNYEFSNIDVTQYRKVTKEDDFFALFEFSAKYDPVPTMLTQDHERIIKGFMGQTTAFKKELLKPSVLIMGEAAGENEVRYLHGELGYGTWTFYGGHDPEDYQHQVGDPPTDLNLHPNSPGYRLILNNVLFPAAKKKKQKT